MKSHKTTILLLSLTIFCAANALADEETQKPRPPEAQVAELKMSLSVVLGEGDDEATVFNVTFQNTGEKDVILNLGMMLANGKALLPDAINLRLTDADGSQQKYVFHDVRYPGVAGRVDDYAVPLRAGSSHTVKLSQSNFYCIETKEFRIKLKPGKYSVYAEFRGGGAKYDNLRLLRLWTGSLKSNSVRFKIKKSH
jgi:hypothetical protein